MRYRKLWFNALWLLSALPGTAASLPVGVTEKRIYQISIDKKPAGIYKLAVTEQPDGLVDVRSQADVSYAFLVFRYKYSYQGHEIWRDDELSSLDSTANDDGKLCAVQAKQYPNGMHIKIQEKNSHREQVSVGPLFSSSYWHLPVKVAGSRQFLEVDSGRVFSAAFERLGVETLATGDKSEVCQHYRLKGGDQVDLWYDSKLRLVRQTSSDDGHKTVIQLQSKTNN